ncbi:MAG: hypothetical protein QXU18_01260 [Thermoplasmatales archaeon]
MRVVKLTFLVTTAFFILLTITLIINPTHADSSAYNGTGQRIVASGMYPHMTVVLNSSLRPINGYTYGIIGVPVSFYAHAINGSGEYTFHWSVNSIPVKNVTTSSNLSMLTWTFTNTSKFGGGYYDYVNVTAADSYNESASTTYYGTFSFTPEIFLKVSGNDPLQTMGKMNITVTDWYDVSPLNISVYVNGQMIYQALTPGWGAGFPISLTYNFYKAGVYNITAIAYDDAGQRIVTHYNVTYISRESYYLHIVESDLRQDFRPANLIFLSLIALFLADFSRAMRSRKR